MDGQVLVRMSVEMKRAVIECAEALDVTEATFCRGAVAERIARMLDGGPGDERPVKRRQRKQLPPEDLIVLSRLTDWVNRHNGALVQLTKAFREGGHAGLHGRAEAVLASCEAAAADLCRLVEDLRQAKEVLS